MTAEEMKAWIDGACYEDLFRKWRFAPAGDPFFQGEIGDYYSTVLAKRRTEVGPAEHTRISKKIGWRDMAYKHKEAFCLMAYCCRECVAIEFIWNSRDGLTPFTVGCRLCGGEMQHVNWKDDVCAPEHVPKKGDRVFVDCTLAIARIYTWMRIDRYWNAPETPMSGGFESKSDALEQLMKGREESEPYLMTIEYG